MIFGQLLKEISFECMEEIWKNDYPNLINLWLPIQDLCQKLISTDCFDDNIAEQSEGYLVIDVNEKFINNTSYRQIGSDINYSIAGINQKELKGMNIDIARIEAQKLFGNNAREKLISTIMWEFTYYGIPDENIRQKYNLPKNGSNLIKLDDEYSFFCDICNEEIDYSQEWYWQLLSPADNSSIQQEDSIYSSEIELDKYKQKAYDVCMKCYPTHVNQSLTRGGLVNRIMVEHTKI